jgi:hypothetical protein
MALLVPLPSPPPPPPPPWPPRPGGAPTDALRSLVVTLGVHHPVVSWVGPNGELERASELDGPHTGGRFCGFPLVQCAAAHPAVWHGLPGAAEAGATAEAIVALGVMGRPYGPPAPAYVHFWAMDLATGRGRRLAWLPLEGTCTSLNALAFAPVLPDEHSPAGGGGGAGGTDGPAACGAAGKAEPAARRLLLAADDGASVTLWDVAVGEAAGLWPSSQGAAEGSSGGEAENAEEAAPQPVAIQPRRNLNANRATMVELRFTPDGRRLAALSDGGCWRLFDVMTGRWVLRPAAARVGAVASFGYGGCDGQSGPYSMVWWFDGPQTTKPSSTARLMPQQSPLILSRPYPVSPLHARAGAPSSAP